MRLFPLCVVAAEAPGEPIEAARPVARSRNFTSNSMVVIGRRLSVNARHRAVVST